MTARTVALGARFDGVAYHEVGAMDERSIDLFGEHLGETHGLRLVVAAHAVALRMALAAHLLVSAGGQSVMAQKADVVPQEGLGHQRA